MKVYAYVDMTRANADKTFPVYVIVKNARGRFFVNTGLSTCDRLVGGRSFPKRDKQSGLKTSLLGKYLSDIEALCLRQDIADKSNAELKEEIRREVFNAKSRSVQRTLADYIELCAATKKPQTAKCYLIAANRVREYDAKATLDIGREWLDAFHSWCIDQGMKVNGAGMIMRNVRSTFNWCRVNGHTQNYPFLDYSVVEEETVPNDLSAEDIRRLRDYPCEPWQKRYVDFFMLSFYMAGINPVDLLMMKQDAVRDGHVSFIRQKTNKQGVKKIRVIVIPLVEEAQAIIERYPSEEGYLIGFMDGRADYHSFMKSCEKALKKVGDKELTEDKAGRLRKVVYHPLFPDITLYSARYSFGSIAANDLDISEQTIGQCLGHSWSKRVTARYISHDQRKVDNAVRRVVEYVAKGTTQK